MERYQRQTMLPEIGEAGQQRLSRARVLVVGAGGLVQRCCRYWQARVWDLSVFTMAIELNCTTSTGRRCLASTMWVSRKYFALSVRWRSAILTATLRRIHTR